MTYTKAATVGDTLTITAREVAQAGGADAGDLDLMRFQKAHTTTVPGLAGTSATGGDSEALAGTLTTAGTFALQVDLMDGGNSYGTYPGELTVTAAAVPDPEPPPVDPEPEPEPGPDPTDPTPAEPATHPLAGRLAAYLGRPDDPATVALASTHLPVVEAFVNGYTRGRGFTPEDRPVAPLQAVIVSAAARLVVNPEQVWQYTAGDYSERPAVLNGWTLPELAVLHRYRRRAG